MAGNINSAPTHTREEHVLESLNFRYLSPCVTTVDALDFGNMKPAHRFSSLPATGAFTGCLRFMLCLNLTVSSALAPEKERKHPRNPGGSPQPRLLMLSKKQRLVLSVNGKELGSETSTEHKCLKIFKVESCCRAWHLITKQNNLQVLTLGHPFKGEHSSSSAETLSPYN